MTDPGLPPLPMRLPEPRPVASADGTEIATYELGGAGPDVLFVHATGFCAGVWTPMAAQLDGYRLAALDVRGHGRSAAPDAGMHWQGTAEDVLATVDALGLHGAFGVGHSMGGASLVLAEQARPGTFRGLWLFEPIIFPTGGPRPTSDDNPLVAGARRRRAVFDSAVAAYANFATKPPFDALAPAALAAYVEYGFEHHADGSLTLRCQPEIEAETYSMGPRHDAIDHLADVRCPTTVVRGHTRFGGPAALAPIVVDGLAAGRLEDHPELGHFGPLEDPTSMVTSLRQALEGGADAGSPVSVPAGP